MNKMRQEMIDAFLAALQEDRIPWHRTWTAIPVSVPRNAVKDTEYRGVNRFWLLHMAERNGYSDPRWCTYKQAKDNGYQVRKGEKGTHVEFWSLYDRKTKTKISEAEADILRQELSPEEYAERIKPVANTYTVFNAEQIEGIPKLPEEAVKTYELDEGGLVQMRETLLENMGVLFQEGGEKAFYRPSEDCIHLPEIRRFESEYDYMATLLHEAGHATGHEGRLHRPTSVEFGTPSYAKEELRAEIASAFTAQALRLSQSGSHMDNHKAYIQSWIKILKNEPDELFRAIRDAEKISDYLIEKGEFNLTRERSEIRKGVEKEREQDSEEKRDVPKVETKETAKDETQKEQPENNFPTPDPNAEPVVTILWSEHSRFHDGETMSLSKANALIESLDRAAVAEDGYYKTKFRIDFVMDGQPNNYIGRQDLGDGDGTLIDHIESYHASYENNVDWDTFVLHNEGKEALEADKVQREMFLHEFVPYLKLHNNLSNMERIATEALQEGGRMTPEETAYHTAMKEYVSKCRAMVNSGDYDLPPVPQRKDFDRELTAYKEHVREEIAQEAAAAGMTVEEYAANGYEPYDAELPDPSVTVSEMTWEQQEEIRLGQENGLDVGVYADPKFTADQMNEIRKGLQNRVDVSIYADSRFNDDQMREIRTGLENGIDVNIYADSNYEWEQMQEIREGLEAGLDISLYADSKYDYEQMERIRNGLEKDQATAAEKQVTEMDKFSETQQDQIQLGLDKGLDVSVYADPKFEASQMEQIRWGLEDGLDVNKYMDPKYNGEQMSVIRNGLEQEVDISRYADPNFTTDQMMQIYFGLKYGVDVSIYADPNFTTDQMEEIRWGLKNGVDVKLYADNEFERKQMEQIRLGLEEGVNVSLYADPKFAAPQMEQIRKGLVSKVDVGRYADPKFTHEQMEQIRKGLEDGLDVSKYMDPKYNGEQMSVIRNGLEQEVDISRYADPNFTADQMMEIHFGMEFGVDVSVYADTRYKYEQMREIRSGLQKELDVSAYADPKFSHEQMSEIQWGLQEGLDARIYADPRFDLEQIKEIQKGLEQGLDVSKYADPKFTVKQMEQIHFGLEDGADVSVYADPNFTADQMHEIRWGLQEELDVSAYADPKFSHEQMQQIRMGLEQGLDVSVYANSDYGFLQMAEIRKGLESGVDVSLYAAQDLNALQMQEIRNGLEKGENIMKTDQKAAILGYYSGVDGSQYMLYKMGDPEKEYLTNGEKQWDDPADIKPILAQLKQIPHLTDRELIMDQLQQNDPYAPITRHMQEIVGEVSFSTNRTVGEVIQFTDAQEYLKTVEEEIEYQSSSGFGYRTFTDDPETRKGIDDIVYDMYGERNPHDLDYYRDLHDSSDKKKMTIEEIYQSMTPEKQEQFDANRDYGDMEAVKRLIEEQRQELQQGQERKQERSRTHGTI